MNKSKKTSVVLLGIFLMTCVCMFGLMLPQAHADQFPSVTDGTPTSAPNGNSATTNLNLKVEDTQLSFTAPSVINFAMKGDGTFICPTDGAAYIKNNSTMPIKVISYEVSNTGSSAHGVSSLEGVKDDNAYTLKVKPNSGDASIFSVTKKGQGALSEDWIMQKNGSASDADKVKLSFSDGKMINIKDGTWGNSSGSPLQTVVWTVSADLSR